MNLRFLAPRPSKQHSMPSLEKWVTNGTLKNALPPKLEQYFEISPHEEARLGYMFEDTNTQGELILFVQSTAVPVIETEISTSSDSVFDGMPVDIEPQSLDPQLCCLPYQNSGPATYLEHGVW